MKRNGWHISENTDSYVLARQWPPRFDISAMSEFPPAKASRLARQVRQDLWRKFQHLRGFSPVVEISTTKVGMTVRAGGRLTGRAPRDAENQIKELLDSPAHRARWLTWAAEGAR
ncbi:hypothetical protein [Mameliella sediminis]|uniref:hypothetical protein n=1 Tax=Mameliella sediminis TaxID=2836866 RepID=UPI001C4466E6|nr:hypothetical protein [Mameliella sediminis]MBV7393857.1 hypothetical protein [Mameliella sediminis]MBY6145419.1 hypothetical protein [Mameliella alba]